MDQAESIPWLPWRMLREQGDQIHRQQTAFFPQEEACFCFPYHPGFPLWEHCAPLQWLKTSSFLPSLGRNLGSLLPAWCLSEIHVGKCPSFWSPWGRRTMRFRASCPPVPPQKQQDQVQAGSFHIYQVPIPCLISYKISGQLCNSCPWLVFLHLIYHHLSNICVFIFVSSNQEVNTTLFGTLLNRKCSQDV